MSSIRQHREFTMRNIGSFARGTVKIGYGLDTRSYGWVKLFVRDRNARKEIAQLREQITATQKLPIHRDELKRLFSGGLEVAKQRFFSQMKEYLSKAQKQEEFLFENLMYVFKRFWTEGA